MVISSWLSTTASSVLFPLNRCDKPQELLPRPFKKIAFVWTFTVAFHPPRGVDLS